MKKIIQDALSGNIRAISRLVTLVESQSPDAKSIMQDIYPHTGHAHIIGVTGSPGAGKSTFCDRLVDEFLEQNKKVAVIAIDPSSPFTGGAILGDRLRMQHLALSQNVFIRSMGSRGSLGGVSAATWEASLIFDACGYDIILVETVGVGQSEIDIMKIADTVCLILTPGMGDDIQIMKAGIMEIADIFVINKCDREGAEKVASDVSAMLKMFTTNSWIPSVRLVSSYSNIGFAEVANDIFSHEAFLSNTPAGKNKLLDRAALEMEKLLLNDLSQKVSLLWKAKCSVELLEKLSCRKINPYLLTSEITNEILK
ncbi:MAG: methylmalonyl Co-A mutase-associated GTPase MeaB [Synergistaceae bacterium]|nr:methylmalonyl Co-A mutase-associated GTPase MeaB [Synergistaceae bacterium]